MIRNKAKLVSAELDTLSLDAFQQIVDAMPATGPRSEANAIRSALWHFGRFLGLDLPLEAFRLQGRPKPRKRFIEPREPRFRQMVRRPSGVGKTGKQHPWRATAKREGGEL